jgi:hypothetical protein
MFLQRHHFFFLSIFEPKKHYKACLKYVFFLLGIMLKVLPLPFLPLPWHREPSLVFSSEMRKQIVRIRQKLYF